MPDDTYWQSTRPALLLLVERLRPEDALAIIKKLVATENEQAIAPLLADMIRGHVARSDDKRRKRAAP